MKAKFFGYILFACSILAACQNQSEPINEPKRVTKPSEKKHKTSLPEQDRSKVIGATWIVDREGVLLRTDSSLSSASLKYYPYGEKIEYSYESDQWLGITVKRPWSGKDPWGYKISKVIDELAFVPKVSTGTLQNLELIPSDLNKIVAMTKLGRKTLRFMQPQSLDSFLRMDLAFKVEFLSQRGKQFRAMNKDTVGIVEKGNVLTLQLKDKQKTFLSTPEKEEHKTVYKYIGHIPSLHKYVLQMQYWESVEYSLIDKTTGLEAARLAEYPHVSPDGKHLLVVDDDVYKEYPEIELYKINGDMITPIVNLVFAFWEPNEEVEKAFWGQDGYFYLSIIPKNHHYVYDDRENVKTQYLRIKIL